MSTAWSFLSIPDGERQFSGNRGYDDSLARWYSFDSTVPNHGRVNVGDIALIRDSHFFYGVGRIERVVPGRSTKERLRCPACSKTGFKERLTVLPRYRCGDCKTAFAQPVIEKILVDTYRAEYASTWTEFARLAPVAEFASAYRSRAHQHAIRELDITRVEVISVRTGATSRDWWVTVVSGPAG